MTLRAVFLGAVFSIFGCYVIRAQNGASSLNNDLFRNYNPTARPVKNVSSTVEVRFDIALRGIQELNEKSQMLTTSTWLRIYWKDEFLTWNPDNYSGIRSIHVRSSQIWVPDIILYNSANADGSGTLYKKIKTSIIVNSNGNITWLSPMILQSECPVELTDFPFDSQTCPLVIGLWTYDQHRVQLQLIHKQGDIRSYTKNGMFIMKGMPAEHKILYYPCCPGVPYARIQYQIKLQRKTVFYLLNFFFPGIVLVAMSFISFMLPPECGERIGMGINNLLAVTFFLLMVSNNVPSISLSIPMITIFFVVVLVASALALIISSIVIKLRMDSNAEPDAKVPWIVDVFINKCIGSLFCTRYQSIQRGSKKSKYSTGETFNEPSTSPSTSRSNGLTRRLTGHLKEETCSTPDDVSIKKEPMHARALKVDGYLKNENISRGFNVVVEKIREEAFTSEYRAKWRHAIKVLDRAFGTVLFLATGIAILYMFLKLPKVLVR